MAQRWLLIAALAAACSSPSETERQDPLTDGVYRVLFIGNSLTNQNDLPRTLEAVAASVNVPLETSAVVFGGYSLEDHWNLGFAQEDIAKGNWDFVVLQQGPSALESSRELLIDFTKRFDKIIRKQGGRTALYMVWPDTVNFGDFARVGGSYLKAAEAVNGLFLPAGLGWRAAWDANSILPLYGPDGFHPSPLGTYLAAIVMLERISGKDTRTLPAHALVAGTDLDVEEATFRLVQNAAHEANTWYQYPW
jgi:hypothetical protein